MKGNFVAVTIVIVRQQTPNVSVLLSLIGKGQPSETPCYSPVRAAFGERLPSGTNFAYCVVSRFVFADRPIRSDLDLIHPDNRDVRDKSISGQRRQRVPRKRRGWSCLQTLWRHRRDRRSHCCLDELAAVN